MAISAKEALEAPVYESVNWKPAIIEDRIAGKVTFCNFVETKFGSTLLCKVEAIEVVQNGHSDIPGLFSIWERAALRHIFVEKMVRPGDEIAICFKGESPTGKGNAKKLFSCVVRRTSDSSEYVALDEDKPVKMGNSKDEE